MLFGLLGNMHSHWVSNKSSDCAERLDSSKFPDEAWFERRLKHYGLLCVLHPEPFVEESVMDAKFKMSRPVRSLHCSVKCILGILCLSGMATAAEPGWTAAGGRIYQAGLIELSTQSEEPDSIRSNAARPSEDGGSEGNQGEVDADADRLQARLANLAKPLASIQLSATSTDAKVPNDRAAGFTSDLPSEIASIPHPIFRPARYHIAAIHNPLYFEEPNLERCGNGCGCATTAASAIHFVANTLTLPYQMVANPPCETHCTTIDCRCGNELPNMRPFQCDLHAATMQGLAVAGFVFLLL